MNTVQTDTRRRCSNTPSLAALTVAAPPPLTPSRPRPDPPPHNARQRNIGHLRGQPPRHADITVCRHNDLTCRHLRAHRGRQPTFAVLTLLRRVAGHRLAVRTWRHPNGTNSLRSLEPTPCGRGVPLTALQSRPAPPLHYGRPSAGGAHPRHTSCGIGTTHRHNDIPTQAPPHAPNAARRRTATLRLPWRSLMKGRAAITHQSKTFNRPTTHCFTEALMAELFGWAALLRLSSLPCCPGHLRCAPRRHTPRLPTHHPDVLPRFANDFAESGLAAINKECGTATHTTATPLPALTVYAVPPVLRSTLIFMPIHNPASSSGHHRPSADVRIGICRDLKTTCARFDYRVNDITALSPTQGVAVGAVTYSARKSRNNPKIATGRGGIVRSTLGGKYSPEPPLRLIKRCFSGLQRF